MSQTLHIVRKDVRRLRWVLVLWVVVLAMRVAFSLFTLTLAESANTSFNLRQLFSPIVTIELLITALIVVRLVHEEALVGFTPFWLTRPYDRGALVRAKLLLATVVLVGLPLLAELITMGLLKAGPVALLTGGSAASFAYAAGTLSLMVAATLTPSFSAFALTLLGVVVGTLMLGADSRGTLVTVEARLFHLYAASGTRRHVRRGDARGLCGCGTGCRSVSVSLPSLARGNGPRHRRTRRNDRCSARLAMVLRSRPRRSALERGSPRQRRP